MNANRCGKHRICGDSAGFAGICRDIAGYLGKRRSRRRVPDCGHCHHSGADHYPGCLNIGPAPDFDHCDCQAFVVDG